MSAKLWKLQPEVSATLGPSSVVTNRAQLDAGIDSVPDATALELVFDMWLGDDILECTPCFVVTGP